MLDLIGPLATFAKVNKYGFIETPYRIVKDGVVTDEIVSVSADEEDNSYIASWDAPLKNDKFKNKLVIARHKRQFILVPKRSYSILVYHQNSLLEFLVV